MSYRDVVLADAPVGYWRLEDDFQDASGGGYHGSAVNGGPSFVSGLLDAGGKAGQFDGVDSGVDLPNIPALTNATEASIECWVQMDAGWDDTRHHAFLRVYEQFNGEYFDLNYLSGLGVRFRLDVSTSNPAPDYKLYDSTITAAELAAGPHHYVGTWDGSVARLYRDGVLVDSLATPSDPLAFTGVEAGSIGHSYHDNSLVCEGTIDECALYASALTQAEVLEHYRVGLTEHLAGSGLLARHVAGDADFPFDADDWSTTGGAVDLDGSGNLRIQPQGAARVVTHDRIPARSKTMSFARVKVQVEANESIGPGFHQPDINNHVDQRYYSFFNSDEYYGITETVAGVFSAIHQAPQGEVDLSIFRPIWGSVDGAVCLMEDWEGGQWSGNSALTSGPIGLHARSTSTSAYVYAEAFIACADRYLAVTGAPAGATIEIKDSGDAVPASAAADANGDATLDLIGVDLRDLAALEVDGVAFTPAYGIYGGDSYDFSSYSFNQPPATPTCSVDAKTDLAVDLSSSAYSDPEGDPHAASQWQIDASGGDFSAPVHDSGEDAVNLTSYSSGDVLAELTDYIARVRHKDDQGAWSSWSSSVAFTTEASNVAPDQPTIADWKFLSPTSLRLYSSAFSDPDGPGEVHAASRWQVQLAGGDWSSPVFDSGLDPVNLLEVDATGLPENTALEARLQHEDDENALSSWSPTVTVSTVFLVQVSKPAGSLAQVPRPECTSGYDGLVLEDSPVGYYRFQEESINDVLEDSSGNGYDGTYQDGSWGADGCSDDNIASLVEGPFGTEDSRAVYAAGPDSRARFANVGGWGEAFWSDGAIPFTVEFWARPDVPWSGVRTSAGTCPQSEDLAHELISGIYSDPGREFGVCLANDRVVVGGRGPNNCNNTTIYTGDLSGWHHYVFRVQGLTVELFVDGAKVNQTVLSLLNEQLRLGGSFGLGVRYAAFDDCNVQPDPWEGALAELALYDYHLTDARIAEHASAAGVGGCLTQVARPEGGVVQL